LRKRGAAVGATLFARGEGIHMGDGELYFACTSGRRGQIGQIFRLRREASGSRPAAAVLRERFDRRLQLRRQPDRGAERAPGGVRGPVHRDVANHLRGITPDGDAYPLALSRIDTEWAGRCFSPDGKTLFVNLYRPAKTVAITGPWIA
jgi:secreted PhoX family phosphatase